MRNEYLTIAALLICASAAARPINPSVEVTNDFVVNIDNAEKQGMEVEYPDSVMQFKLDFDYSVFSTSYKGSYHFTPYEVRLVPEKSAVRNSVLFLDAGVIDPKFNLVWTPDLDGKFKFTVYQDFEGEIDEYNGDEKVSDISEVFGIQGRASLKKADMSFNVAYDGISVDNGFSNGPTHGLDASLRFVSNELFSGFFAYDLGVDYRGVSDRSLPERMGQSLVSFNGSLSPTIDASYRFVMDFDLSYLGYNDAIQNTSYSVSANPHIDFGSGPVSLKLGFGASYLDRLYFYPMVKADARVFGGKLFISAGVDGGQTLTSYSSLKDEMHHIDALCLGGDELKFYSRTAANFHLSLGGCVGTVFQYSFTGGHAIRYDVPELAILDSRPVLAYEDFTDTYFKPSVVLRTDSFRADADLVLHFTSQDCETGYALPAAEFQFRGEYNWRKRLFAGVEALYMGEREYVTSMPSYFDLGLFGEYIIKNHFSVYLHSSNLLCQTVQEFPFIYKNHPCLTLGIRLDLR